MQYKTRLRGIFWIKVVITLLFIYFLVVGSYYAYSYIFEPAYASVMIDCRIKSASSMGYVVMAYYSPSDDEISIGVPKIYDDSWQARNEYMQTKEYDRSVRHEKCHQQQNLKSRLSSCSQTVFGFPIFLFYDEVEAYLSQYFGFGC